MIRFTSRQSTIQIAAKKNMNDTNAEYEQIGVEAVQAGMNLHGPSVSALELSVAIDC